MTFSKISVRLLYRLLFIALVAGTVPAAASDGLPTAEAESVGMSTERLARIGAWLDEIVENGQAAGIVTLVARHGKVVHLSATGTRGLEVSDPMPPDALFDIASMTKPLTAIAALMLYEEGRITLDDSLSDHLPEFKRPMIQQESGNITPAESQMRVRHLFTHTSGVRDPRGRAETYAFSTMDAYMSDFAKLPLRAEPGSKWLYGDSLDVLGHLVERVSGQGLDEFLEDRLLDPLGMTDTHYWPPAAKQDRRAVLVVNGSDDPTRVSREPVEAGESKTFISGASGLHTTASDYWRFCQMLLNGGKFGGKRILGPRTVSLISMNHLEEGTPYRPGLGFGLGFAVVIDPAKARVPYSAGSYYWGGSQGTVFWIDPAEHLVGILMVQVRPAGRLQLRQKFGALVYSAIVE